MDATLRDKAEEMAKSIALNISTQQELSDVMRMMTKSVIERILNAEMDVHLSQGREAALPQSPTAAAEAKVPTAEPAADTPQTPRSGGKRGGRNRRNGTSAKTVQGEPGRMTIETPRDRNGTFEPLLIPKYERRLAGFDEKILALYAKGMSTRDIQELVKTLYNVELSPTLISSVTDAVDEEVTAWRSRLLEPVWPIVYFDGIVVHVRGTSGRVSQHTIYVALGVNLNGKKELLGLWLAENEGAKFWLQVLTDLKNRGLNDIFVACVDGLAGFPEAIRAGLSSDQGATLRRSPRAGRAAVRQHRGQPGGDPRPAEDLSGRDGDRSGASLAEFRSSVGGKVSDDREDVADQVDRHHHALRFPRADPQGDRHDERD